MHTNALAREKSPYLRQHAHNPVDWLPWGEQAFEKARRRDKPIFLSVGYSTCHWCHVMAHESFENEDVAEVLNRDFVPIKVDREERPDVDRIYMLFVQASTGSGGWPMSVWLTPDLKPFFGGTYFPPDNRYGRPGFVDLLQHLARAWKEDRVRVEDSSANVLDQLRAIAGTSNVAGEVTRELFESAFWPLRRTFDARWGGFGSAPKFPRPVVLNYLLRHFSLTNNSEALEMTAETLRGMARGGMHDHLGGGFHRYSVDERWFVPHFEKMLYDQAQLAVSYLEAFQITSEPVFAGTARDIFGYVLRDLTSSDGAFYSAEDADSPDPENPSHAGEGAFYIWRQSEIEAVLGKPDGELFSKYFGVEPNGNVDQDPHGEFTGRNILHETGSDADFSGERLAAAKRRLLEVRAKRPRPHLDNKILTAWNALMISAFAKGYEILGDRVYLDAAISASNFIRRTMRGANARLLRRYCEGDAAVPAFLDDYAFFAQAMLDLFEATGAPEYLDEALRVARGNLREFEDQDHGGFFSTAPDQSDLVLRIKDDYDGAEPSGNSVATDLLLRLAHLTADDEFRTRAQRTLESFAPRLKVQPAAAPQMLCAAGRSLVSPEQIVIRHEGPYTEGVSQLVHEQRKRFAPYACVIAISDTSAAGLAQSAPFLASLERKGRVTIYECRNFACELPRILE